MMRVIAASFLAIALLAAPEKTQKKPKKAPESALTGCVDQRGEQYVLTSEKDMTAVSQLRGKAFSDDNFARYVGRKVTVEGNTSNGVFEVTKITQVAESCSAKGFE